MGRIRCWFNRHDWKDGEKERLPDGWERQVRKCQSCGESMVFQTFTTEIIIEPSVQISPLRVVIYDATKRR